jgi:hypothetical protein
MTVSTENCYAERLWTGVETTFPPGFSALNRTHVEVYARNPANGQVTQLTLDTHFAVTLGIDNAVEVTPIALPAAPRTLLIVRNTPARQDTNFANLGSYQPGVHTNLHDAAALRDAEDKFHRARSLRAPLGETLNDLAPVADRALRYPKFDATGQVVPGGLASDIEGGAVAGQEHAGQAAASAIRAAGFVYIAQQLTRRARVLLEQVIALPSQAAGFATLAQQGARQVKIYAARIAGAASQTAAFATLAQDAVRRARALLVQAIGSKNAAAGFAAMAESNARRARAAAISVMNAVSAVGAHAAAAGLFARRAKSSAASATASEANAAASAASLTDDQVALKARVFN